MPPNTTRHYLKPRPYTHPLALQSRWKVWAQDYTTETVHVPCHMTHKNTTTFSGLGLLHEVQILSHLPYQHCDNHHNE